MKTMTSELQTYRPIITLSRILSRRTLTRFRVLFFTGGCLGLAGMILNSAYPTIPYLHLSPGITMLSFGLWLEQVLLYSYTNSFYFRGLDSVIGSAGKKATGITYDVAHTLLIHPTDITAAFLTSQVGGDIILRTGLTKVQVTDFLNQARTKLTAATIPLQSNRTTSLADISAYIYMYDVAFRTVLTNQGITPAVFQNTVRLVTNRRYAALRRERWWGRDQLSLHRGIGRELTNGTAYELEHYARPLPACSLNTDELALTTNQLAVVTKIERALARSRAANVLLLGNPGSGALELICIMTARHEQGISLNALAGLTVTLLDTEHLLTHCQTADELETELLLICHQAATAGTHIIVIDSISSFITQAAAIGVRIPELLDEYLALPTLHFIMIDTPRAYHHHLETERTFIRRFEEVLIEAEDIANTVLLLEPRALTLEMHYACYFTYPALMSIAESAERYLTNGVMPDSALALIEEIAVRAHSQGTEAITRDMVYQYVSEKTGIPVGPITESERDQLLHLEDILHTRIIGQTSAVSAIARTMRRARVDIERSDKPIGSFLFLGPTGVGKTETAKALAAVFFGSEEQMVRLDMSEFAGPHTLGHLIGDENGTGILTDKLHEHPYTVLLLDEFEKAAPVVHNLFLQILDEGFFTSNYGDRVNARNTIIIATSNAGSDLINATTSARNSAPVLDADIIAAIITRGIFKAELINRFDSSIIFEPLTTQEQGSVAALFIRDLSARVLARGYTLTIADDLLTHLTAQGYDTQFGARAMGRLIQDTLEEKIAQRIIADSNHEHTTITLRLADFTPEELAV